MALVYLDTSVILSLHIVDVHTAKVTNIIQKSRSKFAVSPWVRAEAVSALGIMVRRKDIGAAVAREAFEDMQALCNDAQTLPVTAVVYEMATNWMLDFDLGLRGGGALHAAIAKLHKAQLFTCDKQLVKVGKQLGFKVLTV
jgi:uncharacterized protein